MRPPRWGQLVEKSEAALVAAIEAFNKPDTHYREETFALLCLNAWELLLKAKLVLEKNGDLRIIYVYEKRQTKKGPSKKLYLKRNRSGNPHTIDISRCANLLESQFSVSIPPAVRANLDALTEVRDNAAHFVNTSPMLSRQVLELGTAALRNYVALLKRWFTRDLSNYNLFLMPLGFMASPSIAVLPSESCERKLAEYLKTAIAADSSEPASDFHIAVTVELSFVKAKGTGIGVQITNDPNAPKIQIVDEDIHQKYPWDYEELSRRMRQRYSDFALNQRFQDIRKPLVTDSRYCKRRFLDPGKKNGTKKDFYSPNIIVEFDKHYTVRA